VKKAPTARSAKAEAAARREIPMSPPLPLPAVSAPKPVPAPSPKDLAAAHEYLLARSATRSEAPVMVNGKRLPSEGELLKMPDSTYMNEEQLAFFKHRLQEMERELLQNATRRLNTRKLSSFRIPDRATIEEEHAPEPRTDRERAGSCCAAPRPKATTASEKPVIRSIPCLLARPTATRTLSSSAK
jgi:DnaK suppressor protein